MAAALDVELRLLEPDDAPRVAELLAVAFAEEFEGAGTEHEAVVRQLRTGGWSQRGVMRRVAPLIGVEFGFFVAEHRGQIVGCAGVTGQRLPVINSVAVRPEYRRRGIAEALVHHGERYAAEHGHEAVVLDVLAHNSPAHTLYLKMGYEEYHRYRAYAWPGGITYSGAAASPAAGASAVPTPAWSPASRTFERAGIDSGTREQPPRFPAPRAPLPYTYRLERAQRVSPEAFRVIECAAMPVGFRAVSPSLYPRYIGGPPAVVEWLLGGTRSHRRAVVYRGSAAGFLVAHLAPGVHEGRIEYPLLAPEHTSALASALADAAGFILRAGGAAVRLDVSDERSDHHSVAESLGFHHRWTFVQMVKRLTRSVTIPVRSLA